MYKLILPVLVLMVALMFLTGCGNLQPFADRAVDEGSRIADNLANDAITVYKTAEVNLCGPSGVPQSAAYRVLTEEEADRLHAFCKERGLATKTPFQPGSIINPGSIVDVE